MVRNCRGAELKDTIFCGMINTTKPYTNTLIYNMSEKCKEGDEAMPEVCFYTKDTEADSMAAMKGMIQPPNSERVKQCMADCMVINTKDYCEKESCSLDRLGVRINDELGNTIFCDTKAGVRKNCFTCLIGQEDCEIPDEDGNCPRLCQPPADEPAAAPAEE